MTHKTTYRPRSYRIGRRVSLGMIGYLRLVSAIFGQDEIVWKWIKKGG